jgi:nucleoside-diphosphate-sugar epimerase
MTQGNTPKKILVTGGSGMIGRAVINKLLASKRYLVKAQVRDRIEARERLGRSLDLTMVEMEAQEFTRAGEKEMLSLTKGCNAVIHAAGLVHQEQAAYQEYEVVNVRATQLIAEACAQNQVHTLIFLSTSAVYGRGPFHNIAENGPLAAKTPYAVSKATSENYLQSMASKIPRIIVLRPSLVFGEGDRGNMISLMRQIKEEKYVHIGGGTTAKSLIYSGDLARAIELCLEQAPLGYHVLNASNPEPVTMKELADSIAESLNISKKFQSMPEGLLKLGVKAAQALMPGKVPVTAEQIEKLTTETTCSVDKLMQSTGFKPAIDLKTALKRELAWAQENKLI